jgi:membrane protein YqaA with SNARE-associated domain
MSASSALWALFTSSFLAATLLPGGSEIVLYGVLRAYPEARWTAVAVATVGNTLGALTSYAIGRLIPPSKPLKGVAALQRYGSPVLLLSWVPFVGDPLCVAAGWLRVKLVPAVAFIALGKLARYAAIAVLAVE